MPEYSSVLAAHCAAAASHIYAPETELVSASLAKIWHFPENRAAIGFDPDFDTQRVGIYRNATHDIVAFEGTIPPILSDLSILDVFNNFRSLADWVENAKIRLDSAPPFPGKVHNGFLRQLNQVKTQLAAKLREINGGRPVLVTGHSQGGAIANLATWWLRHENFVVEAGYTFAAPHCGNEEFCNSIQDIVFRLEFGTDIVPLVPPSIDPPGFLFLLAPELRAKFRASSYRACGRLRYGKTAGHGQFVTAEEERGMLFGRLTELGSFARWAEQHRMQNYLSIV